MARSFSKTRPRRVKTRLSRPSDRPTDSLPAERSLFTSDSDSLPDNPRIRRSQRSHKKQSEVYASHYQPVLDARAILLEILAPSTF